MTSDPWTPDKEGPTAGKPCSPLLHFADSTETGTYTWCTLSINVQTFLPPGRKDHLIRSISYGSLEMRVKPCHLSSLIPWVLISRHARIQGEALTVVFAVIYILWWHWILYFEIQSCVQFLSQKKKWKAVSYWGKNAPNQLDQISFMLANIIVWNLESAQTIPPFKT